MKHALRFSALAVLLAMLTAPLPARADATATTSIAQLHVLEPSDSKYNLYHGVIWLDYDKAKNSYRWGGKQCGDQGISESNLNLLFSAFRGKYSITVQFSKHLFESQVYRCITGFTLTRS